MRISEDIALQCPGMTLPRKLALPLFGLLLVLMLPGLAAAQKDKDNEPVASLNFLVIKEDNGKPIRSAAVIMHPVSSHGKQSRGGLELKTDSEGKASFDEIPYGKLRVQVLAQGFQTFGEDYDVNQGQMDFTIRLRRPQGQFSVYDTPGSGKDDKKGDKTPDPNPKPQ